MNIVLEFKESFLLEQKSEWRGHYLAYNDLITKITKIEKGYVNAEKDFVDFLNSQLAAVNDTYLALIASLDHAAPKHFSSLSQPQHTHKPRLLCDSVCEIERFALMNVQALKNLIFYHDCISTRILTPAYVYKCQRDEGFCSQAELHQKLLIISEIYSDQRKQAKEAKEEEEKENEPKEKEGQEMTTKGGKIERTAFERTSIKFWIPQDKLVQLVCAILEHQAVYCFTGGFAQLTSSTYFDNEELEFYKGRLVKEEGSTIVRFRWYGELVDDSVVFVERKVHHEKWVLESSVKERCTVVHSNISDYLRGTFQESPAYKKKNPLFDAVQALILDKKLMPVLKTEYLRTAFQLPDDDSVRLTMDTKLNMLRELDVYQLEALQTWHTPAQLFHDNALHRFPFGVLEVKLHAHLVDCPPEWLGQLMESDMLIRVDKFSKFNHGVCALYPDKLLKKPYWFGGEFSHFFGASSKAAVSAEEKAQKMRGRSFFNSSISLTPELNHDKMRPLSTQASSIKRSSTLPKGTKQAPSTLKAASSMTNMLNLEDFTEGPKKVDKWQQAFCPTFVRKPRNAEANARRLRTEPKTFFANERTFIQWFNAAIVVTTVGFTLRLFGGSSSFTGFGFIVVALFLMIYGLYMFIMRTIKLQARVPSLYFSDTRGPFMLFVVFMSIIIAAMVVSLDNFGTVWFGNIFPREMPQRLRNECTITPSHTLPIPAERIRGLHALGDGDDEVMACGESRIFGIGWGATIPSTTPFTPWNNQHFPISLDLHGITTRGGGGGGGGGGGVGGGDELFVGTAGVNGDTPSLLQVNRDSKKVDQYFSLTGFEPNDKVGGLAWVPASDARSGGYFMVGGPKSANVYVYDVSLDVNQKKMNGILSRKFATVPGATNVTSLSYWDHDGQGLLAVHYASPKIISVHHVLPDSAELGELVGLYYGFDVTARAMVVRGGSATSPEYIVAANDLRSSLVSYNSSGGQLGSCAQPFPEVSGR